MYRKIVLGISENKPHCRAGLLRYCYCSGSSWKKPQKLLLLPRKLILLPRKLPLLLWKILPLRLMLWSTSVEAASMEASAEVVATSTGSLEYFQEICRHLCGSNVPGSFGLLPWKPVPASMEMIEASLEVMKATIEAVEASMEVVKASVVVNVPRLPRKLMKASTTLGKACESFRNLWQLPWLLRLP